MQASYVPGFPRRWGGALPVMRRQVCDETIRARLADVVHSVQSELQRVPIDADDAAIYQAGEYAAKQCFSYCERYKDSSMILDGIFLLCHQMGVPRPVAQTDAGIIARAVDRAWWTRKLKTEHKRRFEHVAIQLGFTGLRTDPYLSRESATRQRRYNKANQKLLESVTVTNGQDEYLLSELAALGTSNKAIRRGELMLRIRGCEEVANDLKHVALFWTITCPSKFHSVGGTNRNYNGATPREAQAYLSKVFSRIRAAWGRQGINPYGFRIAEPHTDGCPHWHMLLFIDPAQEPRMSAIIRKYALQEDGDEKGAAENRVKLVQIEAGQGTAAGYIVKYVSKNIDGNGVGDHKVFEDGRTYNIATDIFGNEEITASQRVTYWSQVWNIRQFQPIGGAPVGVWREMRRVKAETVHNAPEVIKAAWSACQKIESDDAAVAKQASYAEYIRLQGGPQVGRNVAIKTATREITIAGKYETYQAQKPCGVYAVAQENAVYESVRYTWTVKGEAVAIAVAVPWTGVNNCTPTNFRELSNKMERSTKRAAQAAQIQTIKIPSLIDWHAIKQEAKRIDRESIKFSISRASNGR